MGTQRINLRTITQYLSHSRIVLKESVVTLDLMFIYYTCISSFNPNDV